VIAALSALVDEGVIPKGTVGEAIKKYGINPDKPEPTTV
jgi:pyruvate dehydrogenase E1 component